MNACLQSKRPEVRILSGVPLPPQYNQQVRPVSGIPAVSPACAVGPVALPVSVHLNSIFRTGLLAALCCAVASAQQAQPPTVWFSTTGEPYHATGGHLAPACASGWMNSLCRQKWQWEAPKAPFRTWDTYAWYGSWAALAYADWRTTRGALRRGAIESNPLLACEGPAALLKLPGCQPGGINRPVFIAMNLAVPAARLIYDAWLYKRASARQQNWNRRLRWLPQAIKGAVAISNTQQVRR